VDQYTTIDWRVEEMIGYLVLNQPPNNPMGNLFFNELSHLVRNVIPVEQINAILISGKGRHFSSGAELKDLLQNITEHCSESQDNPVNEQPDFVIENLETFRFFNRMTIPVIAVITGVCLGAAFELALSCHIRICSERAILGLPESSFNLLPGLGGVHYMMNLTSTLKTFELVLGGQSFTPRDALSWGIVDKVMDKKGILDYAVRFAKFLQGKKYSRIFVKDYLTEFDKSNEKQHTH
jgi:enoyl-CoA hydratase/carnithine racemase